jgi:hypothetical protein
VGIAALGYYNDSVLRLTYLVGNHFPISVFGLLVLVAAGLNPVLYLVHRRWRLRPGELAVIVAMMLVTCSIPGSGLMRTFMTSLALPIHYNEAKPGWNSKKVLEYVPDRMLPAGGGYDPDAIGMFLTGAKAKGQEFGLTEVFEGGNVPWAAWAGPLTTWLPLIGLTALCVICMGLIVHREWASREWLRYPIALVASTIMEQEEGRAAGGIYRNRLFWVGFIVILLLHTVNGLAVLYPDDMIRIPTSFDFSQIRQKWPDLGKAPQSWGLFSVRLFPTVVAFAFFLASDVSLSLGISQIIYVLGVAALLTAGVDYSGEYMTGGPQNFQLFGSYLGTAILVGYIGRRYFWDVLRGALTFRQPPGVAASAVWACRILMLGVVAMVALLISFGLAWPFAILVVFLILLLCLVMGRINVETGLFFIQPYWQPLAVLMGLFGLAALGPNTVVIVGLVCVVLTIDPRESLMPFLLNGLKICDDKRVSVGRVGAAAGWTYALALAVALVVVFWASYNLGAPDRDGWAMRNVPQFTFNAASTAVTELDLSGELRASQGYGPLERLRQADAKPGFLWAAGIGLALVLVGGMLRLRFTWWPLHPVLFLVWGTYPLANFSHSFLLGWFVKTAVTRFGGGRAHRKTVPLMIGVIAGDLAGGLLWMVHGATYYGVTGKLLDSAYRIFPG